MENKILAIESIDDFIEDLIEMRGLVPLDKHLLHLLFEIKSDIPLHTRKFLTLCMSLLDDGNTRVPLDAAQFTDMWTRKWNGLVMLRVSTAEEDIDENAFATADDFASIISEGIQDILTNDFSAIMESRETDTESAEDSLSKPFILAKRPNGTHLYFTKHFDAKCVIEKAANILFKNGRKPSKDEIAQCTEKVANMCKLKDGKKFIIKERQAEAIIRGQTENLVVTGGPGTGKTTVVLYILWNLLASHSEMLDWNIYLAAPSGKAADRMRESLVGGLSNILDEQKSGDNERIFRKLNELESSTIHRLLRFSRSKGCFTFNRKEQFPKNSIFVIDEASMIDIEMFAALLEAIPEGARIFILGDSFQLPSVDSGAVLGEILKVQSGKNFSVKLNESNRFDDRSNIGKLAAEIKEVAECNDSNKFVPHKFTITGEEPVSENENVSSPEFKDKVLYKCLETDDKPLTKKEEEKLIESFIGKWSEEFAKLPELAEQINPQRTGIEADDPDKIETKRRNDIWRLSLTKRILCAERRGLRGIENINKKVCSKIKSLWRTKKKKEGKTVQWDDSGYFPGQLLIITKNQEMFKLYNGDTGIVVFDGNTPCLMLKKAAPQRKDLQKTRDDYVFYPLSVLPEDSISTAFAITIHKSQGSEYNHVTMFLPTKIGHPLLTNQIIYTGITRAMESVTIIANDDTFKAAVTTVSERDTGISL
jgi:exodeoxyribonuclease V alpha subunit